MYLEPHPETVVTERRPSIKRHRRPFGVYAIIILALLNQALIILPYLLPNLPIPSELLAGLPSELLPADSPLTEQVLAGLTTIATLIVVAGLWAYRRWAWVATMVVVGLYLILGLWRYLQGNPDYFSMLLDVVIVFYMNQRDVQNAFERRRRPSETHP